jgi:hypothetical protein
MTMTFHRFEGSTMPGYITTLRSPVRGDLDLRRAPTRAAAFKAAQELAAECLAREAERGWLHNEVVSIRVEADPDQR